MLAQSIHYAKKGVFTTLTLFLAIYGFAILLTYTPNDPSWSHISSNIDNISNIGGAVGAWIADLLYSFFGGAAWLLILLFIYESIMIWRNHNLPFIVLRVVAYIFLLLAVSALLSYVDISIHHLWSANALGTQLQSLPYYGGIVGYEVLMGLIQSLTQYGALAFLIVFTLITATFAFDIRWYDAFVSIFNGNVIYGKNRTQENSMASDEPKHSHDFENETDTYRGDNQFDNETNADTDIDLIDDSGNFTTDSMSDQKIREHQLELELPDQKEMTVKQHLRSSLNRKLPTKQGLNTKTPDSTQTTQNDSEFENIFNEFLVNSGLSATLLEVQREEAERQARLKNQALGNNLANKQSSYSDDKARISKNTTSVKLESEIADDQQVIDELLDEQARQLQLDNQAQNQSASTQRAPTLQAKNKLANHSKVLGDSITDDTKNLEDDQYTQTQNTYELASDIKLDKTPDMTPTNTPPADPTQFAKPKHQDFKIEYREDNQQSENDNEHEIQRAEQTNTQTNTPTVTNIQFEVPEGEESNYIKEMVSEEDDLAEQSSALNQTEDVTMPHISDDSAFKSKSRAMQTAKYRKSLSPIPDISILDKPDPDLKPSYTQAELSQLSELLEIKLQDFNVKATVVNAIPGPVVTRFEVELAAGIKASKVTGISRDLARSLSMASLRVVEVIPGKPYIGIEVPNKKRQMVRLIELLTTQKYKDPKAQISMAMGKNIGGKPIITDLARAPHMLVAGTTGSGKSVLVNSMLLSMLLKYTPSELRLILIDPKQLELANYNDIPHLLTPVVTDMDEAASSLSWCVAEMERRYQLMSLLKVRKLGEFNKKVIAAEKAGKPMIDPLWRPNDSVSISDAPKLKTLPMIVIVADEFADMIMQVGKQAEELITRLAQKSRAAGIHLMLATQRPSVDVITGLIKANIPVRAALRVNSKVDSRTILDAGGAEDMLGNGDMLFLGPGQIEPERVHGAYVSDEEVNRVCDAWRERGAPDYIDNMASNFELSSPSGGGNTSGEDDELYDQAVAFIMETRKVSASSIQRKFSIGYNRAARIVDSMEEAGLVSSMGKSGKRELLM